MTLATAERAGGPVPCSCFEQFLCVPSWPLRWLFFSNSNPVFLFSQRRRIDLFTVQGGRQALGPFRLSKLGVALVLTPFSVGMGPFGRSCGRSVARVSATLGTDMRERFFSAACRQYRFYTRCSVYSVVLEVVLSKCYGRLEVSRSGRDQQRDDMADQMTDYLMRTMMTLQSRAVKLLSHKHALRVRAREKTVVFVMHAAGVYSVYTSRRIVGNPKLHA